MSPIRSNAPAQPETPDWQTLEQQGCIRVEGEDAVEHNFQITGGDPAFLLNDAPRSFESLSGNRACLLLTKEAPAKGMYRARYALEAQEAGDFDFWTFEHGREWSSPFRWRIGDGSWNEVATSDLMLNSRRIANDGPTFAWSPLGKVQLPSGRSSLEIEVTAPRKDGLYLFSADFFLFTPVALSCAHAMRPPFSMLREQIPGDSVFLYDQDPAPGSLLPDDFRPRLDLYLVTGTQPPRGAVIVCPGGAYRGRAPHEGTPVAEAFRARGYHAFVLQYRVRPHSYTASAADAARAVRWVRQNAGKFGIQPDRIAICGFSAGGHLAAGTGVHFDKELVKPVGDSLDSVSARPDALILIYPWIPAADPHTATAGLPSTAEMHLAEFVTKETPPAFFLHASDDPLLPENSWRFASALNAQKIPYELHVLPTGGHGFGLGEKSPSLVRWVDWSTEWLNGEVWKSA